MGPMPHILVPFDFSDQCRQIVPFVRVMADKLGARITVISVIPPVWDAPSAEFAVVTMEDRGEKEKKLKLRLEKVCAEEFVGLNVAPETAFGDPALKIVEFANTNDVSLIMMPTHGFGVFRRLLLGSVTSKVLHDAKCPVWTAAHLAEQRAPANVRTVMCAVDGDSPAAIELVRWANDFTGQFGASLRLLHVVPRISDWLSLPSERDLQEKVRSAARSKLETCLKQAGLNIPLRVAVGNVVETVTEEARQEGADLLVIGQGIVSEPFGGLRSNVYGIIQQSATPVLSR